MVELADVDRIDRVDLPQREAFEILCIVARGINAGFPSGGAGNMAAVKK